MKNLILTFIALVALLAVAEANACRPCQTLNESAKASKNANPEKAEALLDQAIDLFQEVVAAQPKLEVKTAHDMLTMVVNLLEYDETLDSIEAIRPFYHDPKYKDLFQKQLKRFTAKEQKEFLDAMKQIDRVYREGNG